MRWWVIGLSIMATQASAITFIGTTGQGYFDGLRFVQFYFGLPIAMVIIAAVAVPFFHHSGVYTAYEYLEKRFDRKTRNPRQPDFPRAARAGCRVGALRAGGRSFDHGRMARVGHDRHNGRAGRRLHLGRRYQGRDVDRRAADDGDVAGDCRGFSGGRIDLALRRIVWRRALSCRNLRKIAGGGSLLRLAKPLQPMVGPDRRHLLGAGVFRLRSVAGAGVT